MAGREEELAWLLRRWSRAKAGKGQAVLLSGEAGIGKSRLTAAVLEELARQSHRRLRFFCSPQHTDTALFPVIEQMERAAGLSHQDEPQVRLDKLDALLSETGASIEDRALMAGMLSLPNDGRYSALLFAPEDCRQRTLEMLVERFEAQTVEQPVLMIFEDVHWIDPTSLELLDRIVEAAKRLPALLIITFRPDFTAPWAGQSHVTSLSLNRLEESDVEAIMCSLAGGGRLPADVRWEIVERTDGIPLFVEEMTKAVLEAENVAPARPAFGSLGSPGTGIPATLHASLLTRLDRLGPAKTVAQVGAALGRTFTHVLLASVYGGAAGELDSGLNRLVEAGLLFRHGQPPHASYVFKHALVQDVAYGMLLREPRRSLHARILETLEHGFAELAESQPELLAHHATEAGLTQKAARLWSRAGLRSLSRSALIEAVSQLTRALDQIATLPGTEDQRREQIKLQVALANAIMHTKGYAAPETRKSFDLARSLIERADALGEALEDPWLRFSTLYGLWVESFVCFDGDRARTLAEQFMALVKNSGARVPVMIGHRLMGTSLTFTGNLSEAKMHFDHAIAMYDRAEHGPLATLFGHDPKVAAHCYRAWALWLLGYPLGACTDTKQALDDARAIGKRPV
jgi:predicted ATPase